MTTGKPRFHIVIENKVKEGKITMTNSKSTKRALLTSAFAIFMCAAMLIGTTFAWFTDTASTAVNRIESGSLKVDIVDASGKSLNGKSLSFKDVTGNSNIYWEPGATFKLDSFRIVNKGNLAFKYKVLISGINGNAELLKAIDFFVQFGDKQEVALADWNGILLPEGKTATRDAEEVKETSLITISAKMRSDAGNEYQGLSIDGLGITVVATQYTYENDSFGNTYDENAVYPVAPTLSNTTAKGKITAAGTTLGNMSDTKSPTASQVEIPANAVTEDTDATFTMKLTDITPDSVTYEISLVNANDGTKIVLNEAATVTTNIGSNLINVTVKHSGTAMTAVTSESELTDGKFYYDAATGKLIICTKSFSPFEISYTFNGVAAVNGIAYSSLPSAIAVAEAGDTVTLLKNVDITSALNISKKLTLDLNGFTLSSTAIATLTLASGADVTVMDSSAASGVITNAYSGKADATTVDLQGQGAIFTLKSGTVQSNAKDNLYTLAIANSKKKECTVNINGGTVSNPDGHVKSRAISASNGMTVNINGGTVNGGLYALDTYVGSVSNINGGKLFANANDGRSDEYGTSYAIHAKGEAEINIGSAAASTTPNVKGIKFESSGVKTELPTINLAKGEITNPVYSMEAKYNYTLFKLGITADAPVTFTDNTANFFLTDDLQMVQIGNVWKVTAK